jgi:hypothetical protein
MKIHLGVDILIVPTLSSFISARSQVKAQRSQCEAL